MHSACWGKQPTHSAADRGTNGGSSIITKCTNKTAAAAVTQWRHAAGQGVQHGFDQAASVVISIVRGDTAAGGSVGALLS